MIRKIAKKTYIINRIDKKIGSHNEKNGNLSLDI